MNASTAAYLAEDQSHGVFPTVLAVTILAFLAVLLRLASRFVTKSSLWWDDWTILIAMALEVGLTAGILYADRRLDAGRHMEVLDAEQKISLPKNLIAVQELYFAAQTAIKISLLLLYYRVFGINPRFRIAAYIAGAIVVAWWVSCFIPTLLTCIPIEAFWFPKTPGKRCINLRAFGIANGVFNMMTDIMVLALSIPMVWQLQLGLKKKLLISGAFLVGAFVCVISIVRLSCFPGFDLSDPSFGVARIYLWTSVESCCAIVATCLPTIGPLLVRCLGMQASEVTVTEPPSSTSGVGLSKRHQSIRGSRDSGTVRTSLAPPWRRHDSFSSESKFYRLDETEMGSLRVIPSS